MTFGKVNLGDVEISPISQSLLVGSTMTCDNNDDHDDDPGDDDGDDNDGDYDDAHDDNDDDDDVYAGWLHHDLAIKAACNLITEDEEKTMMTQKE